MNRPVRTAQPEPSATAVASSSSLARDLVAAAAVATTAAFAGGALLTQTVIVPHWRSMEPVAFLDHFATYGPAVGATLFPIEVIATLALTASTYRAVRNRRPGRGLWAMATACMVGTLLLLPIYFAGANTAMLRENFPVTSVAGELADWYAWNWARTGLALLATVVCCFAIRTIRPTR